MPTDALLRDAHRSGAPATFLQSYADRERRLAAPFEERVKHHEREMQALDAKGDALETGAPALRHLKAELEAHAAAAVAARASADEHRNRERDALDALASLPKRGKR